MENQIEKIRSKKKLSQKNLADKIGISVAELAEIEANETDLSVEMLTKISDALNVSVDSLLKKKDNKKNKKPSIFLFCVIILVMILAVFIICHFLSSNVGKISEVDDSVVKISCFDYWGNEIAQGSGFVAYSDTSVVTNYHVVEEAYTMDIYDTNGNTYVVKGVESYSPNKDIAILRINKSFAGEVLELGDSSKLKKGSEIFAIGSPEGFMNTASTGIISGFQTLDDEDYIQITAPISEGSSGGALFNKKGKVIGVTSCGLIDGQNINFAIPINEVTSVLNRQNKATLQEMYLATHPWVTTVSGSPIKVTLDDLRNNPSEYTGKTIMMFGYIAAVDPTPNYSTNIYFTDENGGYANFSDMKKYHDELDFENGFALSTFIIENHVQSKEISTKTPITIIGDFSYQGAMQDDGSFEAYVRRYSRAYLLNAHIIN